jgi:hypothetical protein
MATFTLADGTPIIWADATDWPDGGAHGFGNDNYQIDLTSLANNAARQGVKGDLGATRSPTFAVRVGIEVDVAPVSTGAAYVEFYWSASSSGTAATGNDGGTTGTDAAYADPTEWTRQLTYIGSLICTADAAPVVQIQTINEAFQPPTRYGMPVVVNKSGQALEGDAIEMFIALIPTTPASA